MAMVVKFHFDEGVPRLRFATYASCWVAESDKSYTMCSRVIWKTMPTTPTTVPSSHLENIAMQFCYTPRTENTCWATRKRSSGTKPMRPHGSSNPHTRASLSATECPRRRLHAADLLASQPWHPQSCISAKRIKMLGGCSVGVITQLTHPHRLQPRTNEQMNFAGDCR